MEQAVDRVAVGVADTADGHGSFDGAGVLLQQQLTDTIPVQGPETEVLDRIVYGDFLALRNERDREVVVLLYSGMTNLTQIAATMGYRNSPVSKRLNHIREQAARFFDER